MWMAVTVTAGCSRKGDDFDPHGAGYSAKEVMLRATRLQIVVFSVHNGRFGEAILNFLSYS